MNIKTTKDYIKTFALNMFMFIVVIALSPVTLIKTIQDAIIEYNGE